MEDNEAPAVSWAAFTDTLGRLGITFEDFLEAKEKYLAFVDCFAAPFEDSRYLRGLGETGMPEVDHH